MSVQELQAALEETIELHDELLRLAREKVRIVIENRVDELIALTTKETRIAVRLEDVSRMISRASEGSWAEIGLQAWPGAKLSDLIRALPKPERKVALTDLSDRLLERHRELKVINERNQLLIRQSLDFIQFELDVIAGPYDEATYSSPTSAPQNGYAGSASRSIFDTRA